MMGLGCSRVLGRSLPLTRSSLVRERGRLRLASRVCKGLWAKGSQHLLWGWWKWWHSKSSPDLENPRLFFLPIILYVTLHWPRFPCLQIVPRLQKGVR